MDSILNELLKGQCKDIRTKPADNFLFFWGILLVRSKVCTPTAAIKRGPTLTVGFFIYILLGKWKRWNSQNSQVGTNELRNMVDLACFWEHPQRNKRQGLILPTRLHLIKLWVDCRFEVMFSVSILSMGCHLL